MYIHMTTHFIYSYSIWTSLFRHETEREKKKSVLKKKKDQRTSLMTLTDTSGQVGISLLIDVL